MQQHPLDIAELPVILCDEELLALELQELNEADFDLSLTGFEPKEIDDLLLAPEDDDAANATPPLPDNPVSRLGDLWLCGRHRVLCADCTKPESVSQLLGDRNPSLMVTDPPYGIQLDSEWRDRAGADALRRASEESAAACPLRFKFMVEGAVKEMHPIVRDEVYRIGYEAIRNAFHHSGGTEVQVVLTYAHSLDLIVRDDGKGIDPDIAVKGKAGHFGLAGMQEPAVRIAAKLTICGSANAGTKLELIVPGYVVFTNTDCGGKDGLGNHIL